MRTKHGWVLGNDGTYRPDATSSEGTSCSGPGICADCTQEAASIAFHGQQAQEGATVTCPTCSTTFVLDQPVRMTESVEAPEAPAETEGDVDDAAEAAAKAGATKPYGDVAYADPGYLDGAGTQVSDSGLTPVARYALNNAKRVRAAWSYINQPDNAAQYTATQLKSIKGRIRAAAAKFGVRIAATEAAEAMIDGARSFDDVRELVRTALCEDERERTGEYYAYCYIADLTDAQVVYSCGGKDELYQRAYTLNDAGEVTLGEPARVVRTYTPAPAAMSTGEAVPTQPHPGQQPAPNPQPVPTTPTVPAPPPPARHASFDGRLVESGDHIEGQLLDAKGKDDDGRRVFGVRIIAYGDSKNGRRYPEAVMQAAIPLYESAKAYDHHRTEAELKTSTITGMVGYYTNVHGTADGLEAELHLLPSARHTAEALDAALAAQERGQKTPLVGISHDVQARYRPIVDGDRHLQEAIEIVKVNSADIVAEPAAGGQATRMVAGGTDPAGSPDPDDPAGDGPASSKEAHVGETAPTATAAPPAAPNYSLEQVLALLRTASPAQLAEATGLAGPAQATTEAGGPVTVRKDAFFGKLMIEQKVTDAGLPMPTVEAIYRALPDQITEAAVDAHIVAIKASLGVLERAQLAPSAGIKVTKEAYDKKAAALDAMFMGDYAKGYRSIKEAFCDFTGLRPASFDEDFNRRILRESMGGFDSALVRTPESMTSSSWNVVLGDSITRRMVAEYNQPSLQTWRQVVGPSIVPVNDFRTQRVERIGGYGTLPAVAQGGTYNPLTSPTNEEATYAISKRGGTEDVTLEMIANDDVRAIQKIPVKLGLAAAQTLYRFVWDIFQANALIYDGVALFAAGHNNTDATALSGAAVSAGRLKMRTQAAFGDTSNILSLVPRHLVVVNELEELAFELVTSAVALPAGAPVGAATNIPNLHQGLNLIIVDYWTPTTSWFLVADPNLCPTIEIGFYQGRETPELFTQADPSVGSVFTADKITYKIRHIYSGAVLDFRGFYRGNA